MASASEIACQALFCRAFVTLRGISTSPTVAGSESARRHIGWRAVSLMWSDNKCCRRFA